jgi:HAE1 family hydrophobic/amphiphilic exporter-1
MKLWELSVRRPIFMSCVLVALMVVGGFSLNKLPVDMFPDVTFPIVTVTTVYPGAGPNEIETLISKPIEEELSTISGVKVIRSINRESMSVVVAEFFLDVDIRYAEQQVRDRVSSARRKLPDEAEESTIAKVDPSAQPIMVVAVQTSLKGGELYDLANEVLKPKLEQVNQVGRVEVVGVRKREIQLQLDRNELRQRDLSVMQVVGALKNAGENIPAGKTTQRQGEKVYRTIGEFSSLSQIENSLVSFFGNDASTRVRDVGQVVDTLVDEKVRAYLNGEGAALLYVYKQSGSNTIRVASGVAKQVAKLNLEQVGPEESRYKIEVVRDLSRFVWANVVDVVESIGLGVILTVLVVFLFLGSARSTVITGLAIPISLIGSLPFMYLAGQSINVMSLLAFSLAVGLLIDDAIVVRENIFRHLQMGKSAVRAAIEGTSEVALAVVAVTLAVVSVFGPIAFLSGVVGQFFKSFGLGVCFIMGVSLFDALTNAAMLSAYFGGKHESVGDQPYSWASPVRSAVTFFERTQSRLESGYEKALHMILKNRGLSLLATGVVVVLLAATVMFIPKTFLPPQDSGEFILGLELKPGTSLEEMTKLALEVDQRLATHPNVESRVLTVGNSNGAAYVADFYVKLTAFSKRSKTTTEIKAEIREQMKDFAVAHPTVKDVDIVGAGQRPFVVSIRSQNLEDARRVANALYEKLKDHPGLLDPETSDKPGLPEFQVDVNGEEALRFGVTPAMVGAELRAQVEGMTPAKFRQNGVEYDIRVRVREDQRNLEQAYLTTGVPNINGRLVPLNRFSKPKTEVGSATINREDRARYISVEADLRPGGPGMGGVISDIDKWLSNGEIEVPAGVTHRYVGQAENFQELAQSIVLAGLLAIIFIYLILASLYESLVTPFAIMLVIPLGVFGGFFGLFVMRSSLDLFSMIGCVLLMGLATKNSIILIDYINQKVAQGLSLYDAIIEGGKTRLRPILMTSIALIVGMLPVAIGLNEASSQRRSLGIAVVGGVAVSTLLTLIVVPAVYSYIENFRRWMIARVGRRLVNDSVLESKEN